MEVDLGRRFWRCASSAQAPSLAAADWPQFRGNPRLTGVAADALPATFKVLWSYELGDMNDSSPAIADGVVYAGAMNGTLVALDLATGKLRWKYSTGGPLGIGESSPAVATGVVYVGDLDGVVHAVNATDGTRIWTFKTGSEVKASPIVVNGLVDHRVRTTRISTRSTRGPARLRWKFQTKGQVHATPAVQGDLLFLAGCDELFRAIRIADGRQMYEIPTGAYTGASPVVDGDRAYLGTFDYEVIALDLKARKVLWRYSDKERQFAFYSSAALANGRVVLGGRDKVVHAIDAATGMAAWTFTTRARVDSSPAIVGGRVYLGSGDGRFYVLDLATGRKHWEFEAGSGITASPAVSGGRIVFISNDGIVYCLG